VAVYAYKQEVDEWWRQRDAAAAEVAPRPLQSWRRIRLAGWVMLALVAALGVLRSGVWRGIPAGARHDSAPAPASHPGIEEYPSLSPDAQRLAFSWNGGELRNFDIYIRALDDIVGDPVRLTVDPAADFNPTWSPDGFSIAFVRRSAPSQFEVMVMPATGGDERSIAICQAGWDRRAGSYLAWTPDGRGLMVLQREAHGHTAGLLLLSPKSIQSRRLVLPLDGSPGRGSELLGGNPCLAAG
jgi:hypothetical protein